MGVELGSSPSETLQNVPICPMSQTKIEEATLRSNCQERCGEQCMYHCLPDTKKEHFFEMCAPKVPIIGMIVPLYLFIHPLSIYCTTCLFIHLSITISIYRQGSQYVS